MKTRLRQNNLPRCDFLLNLNRVTVPKVTIQNNKTPASSCETKLVETREELEEALRLVYRKYNIAGFQKKNSSGMRVNFHNLLPTSYTLIRKNNSRIEGTLTVVQEYQGRLPSSELFAEEIKQVRNNNSLLCELSGLAINTSSFKSSKTTLLSLFKAAFILGFDLLGCTDFCMMINPSHCNFYKNEMQFEKIGPVRYYDKVNNAPAILLKLDLLTCEQHFQEKKPRLHDYFFLQKRTTVQNKLLSQLSRHKKLFNEQLAKYFLKTETAILSNLTADEKQILSLYFPQLTKTLLV